MACVDAALARAPADEATLLHVTDAGAVDAAQGAFSALLGRGGALPAAQLQAMAQAAATEVLEAAAARLGLPARQLRRQGRPEREVVQAARGADLLILARQGGEAGPRAWARRPGSWWITRPARSCWSGRGGPGEPSSAAPARGPRGCRTGRRTGAAARRLSRRGRPVPGRSGPQQAARSLAG